jgi:hypothetical protein
MMSEALQGQTRLQRLEFMPVIETGVEFEQAFRAFRQNRYLTTLSLYQLTGHWQGYAEKFRCRGLDADEEQRLLPVPIRNRVQFATDEFAVGAGRGFALSLPPVAAGSVGLPVEVGGLIGGHLLDHQSQINLSSITTRARTEAIDDAAEGYARARAGKPDPERSPLEFVHHTRFSWKDDTSIPHHYREKSLTELLKSIKDNKQYAIQRLNALPAFQASGARGDLLEQMVDAIRDSKWASVAACAKIMHQLGYPPQELANLVACDYDAEIGREAERHRVDPQDLKAFIFVAHTACRWPNKVQIAKLGKTEMGRHFIAGFVRYDLERDGAIAPHYFMALPALRGSGFGPKAIKFIYTESLQRCKIPSADHARVLLRLSRKPQVRAGMLRTVAQTLGRDEFISVMREMNMPVEERDVLLAAIPEFVRPPAATES